MRTLAKREKTANYVHPLPKRVRIALSKSGRKPPCTRA